jgi:hypothetical protein
MTTQKKGLIITSGDASDFDGFMALPLYYKAALAKKMDVCFVMNYPAYFGDALNTPGYTDPGENALGSGFSYNHAEFVKASNDGDVLTKSATSLYTGINSTNIIQLFSKYANGFSQKGSLLVYTNPTSHHSQSHSAYKMDILLMSYITYYIINQIWGWCNMEYGGGNAIKPRLLFTIGGINTTNPFSQKSIKNELSVYGDIVFQHMKLQASDVSGIYNIDHFIRHIHEFQITNLIKESVAHTRFNMYQDIYIDMNGSVAWFNSEVAACFEKIKLNVKGVFVMGGVLSYTQVNTMGAGPYVNRFSSATMNQLYHSHNTLLFFEMFNDKLYFVSNNEINAQFTYFDLSSISRASYLKKETNEYHVFTNEMREMGLLPALSPNVTPDFVTKCFNAFYAGRPADRKPFDVISALALVDFIYQEAGTHQLQGSKHTLLYDTEYGVTILFKCGTGRTATKANIITEYIEKGLSGKEKVLTQETDVYDAIKLDSSQAILIKNVYSLFSPPGTKEHLHTNSTVYKAMIQHYMSPTSITRYTSPTWSDSFAWPIPHNAVGGARMAFDFKKTDKKVEIGKRMAVAYKKQGDRKTYVKVKGEYKLIVEARKMMKKK